MSSVFSTAYLPPVQYLLNCVGHEFILIDAHEHFVKQSFMSRCSIYGPNGKQDLIIPVEHKDLYTIPVKEVRISNDSRWQIIHWRSIQTAYRNSPYFEFYEDAFRSLFEKKFDFLLDLNTTLLAKIFEIKKIKTEIRFTDSFLETHGDHSDLRKNFHPKKEFSGSEKYYQVFQEKHGFIDRLSVIDHLFNQR